MIRAELTEDMLSAYLDDELSDEERAAVDEELAGSAEWRAVRAELDSTRALVRALPVREAPTGFWDAVLDPNIAPPIPIESARSNRGHRAVRWLAGVGAAAAIAAVVLVPGQSQTKPPVASLVAMHAARSSVSEEPVSELATVATGRTFR